MAEEEEIADSGATSGVAPPAAAMAASAGLAVAEGGGTMFFHVDKWPCLILAMGGVEVAAAMTTVAVGFEVEAVLGVGVGASGQGEGGGHREVMSPPVYHRRSCRDWPTLSFSGALPWLHSSWPLRTRVQWDGSFGRLRPLCGASCRWGSGAGGYSYCRALFVYSRGCRGGGAHLCRGGNCLFEKNLGASALSRWWNLLVFLQQYVFMVCSV